jgi:opacity protein-like surface antigen
MGEHEQDLDRDRRQPPGKAGARLVRHFPRPHRLRVLGSRPAIRHRRSRLRQPQGHRGFAGFSSSDTSIGWTAGVGLEYAFDPFWSARIEYLHISLDGFTPSAAAGGRVTVGRLDNDIIRGGFNYKLMP